MSLRRPLITVLATIGIVASGLVGGGVAASADDAVPSAPGGYTPAAVHWGKCTKNADYPADFQCGTVAVPLDWDHVGGTKIRLAVTRVKHTAKPYQGVMLVNPGGPGGSGTIFASLKDAVPKGAGDGYDWIGFDPRGVGDSRPALSCISDYFTGPRPPYEPTTKSIERRWITRSKAYAAACVKKNGPLLAHITTEDTVKDMDAIRVALRQPRINYLGYSYGTSLGQVYGTLFPSHLGRVILDSNVDPRKNAYESNFDQDIAFQKVFDAFTGWIAKYDRVYHLGTTRAKVSARIDAAEAALNRKPVGTIGGDEFSDTLLTAGYSQSEWPSIAKAASAWIVKHDTKALRAAYDADGADPTDNDFAVYTATQCNESYWPQSYTLYRADVRRVDRVAPFETWGNAWYNAPCLYWPLPRQRPVEVDGSKVGSALLIDETLDAATPYAGSVETRRRFPHAVLLAEPGGTSHATSLEGNACVDNTIARYLKDGTLPKRKVGHGADTTCKPLPVPKPGKASGGGSSSGSGTARVLLRGGVLR